MSPASRVISLSSLVLSTLLGWACEVPGEDHCDVGSEYCACTAGASCDPGLTCMSNYCVPVVGDESSGAEPAESSAAMTSSSSADDSAEASSGGVDECTAQGGELLAGGFCFKECTYEEYLPGSDLFEDCLALHMVCNSPGSSAGDVTGWCRPAGWNEECAADADCGLGGVCVTQALASDFPDYSYCQIDCSTDGQCAGTLSCVTSCPTGDIGPLGFCDDVGSDAYPFACCPGYPDPELC